MADRFPPAGRWPEAEAPDTVSPSMTPDEPAPMPQTATPHDADVPQASFTGWYDSSHDLLRGLMVAEWPAHDAAPAQQPLPPPKPTLSFGIDRRRRPRN